MELNRAELGDPVLGLDWSGDGRYIAAAGISGPCGIFDVASGKRCRQWKAHAGGVLAVGWSATEDVFATGGQDGTVRWWSPGSDDPLRSEQAGGSWVEHVTFSPNGRNLATGAGKTLRIWNSAGESLFEFQNHESTVSGLEWRADSKGVATSCYGKIRCFRLGENQPYEEISLKASFVSLALSPNGRAIGAGTQENTIQFFRLPSAGEEPLRMSGYPSKVKHLAWDSGARFLASGGGDMITVWDVRGRGPAGTIPLQCAGHPGLISALAFQKTGELLASGCASGKVFLWNPAKSRWPGSKPEPVDRPLRAFGFQSGILCLKWSPDQTALAVGCQDGSVGWIRV